MTKLFIFFFVTLIIFIISTEVISLRLIYNEIKTVIKIDFNIFGITLSRPSKRVKKRKNNKKRKLPFPSFGILLSFIKSIIIKSDITVYSMKIEAKSKTPMNYAIKRGLLLSALCTFISYLKIAAKNIKYDNIVLKNEDNNDTAAPIADVKITLPLIFLLSSIMRLAVRYIKELINKNVRKQNERYN